MKLSEILQKKGYAKNPLLGVNSSFRNQLALDRIRFGTTYVLITKPNLIQRIFRLIFKKPIYVKILNPCDVRISVNNDYYKPINQ